MNTYRLRIFTYPNSQPEVNVEEVCAMTARDAWDMWHFNNPTMDRRRWEEIEAVPQEQIDDLAEACRAVRERVSGYTPEQRAELLRHAHEVMCMETKEPK